MNIEDMEVLRMGLGVKVKKRVVKGGEWRKMKISVVGEKVDGVKGRGGVVMIRDDGKEGMIRMGVKGGVKWWEK